MAGLDLCLSRGQELTEVTEIDNNVLVAHGEIRSLALASTGQMALASTDGAIKLWSVSGELEGTEKPTVGYDAAFGEDNPPVSALAYAPDGDWIAAGRENGELAAWNPSTGELMESMTLDEGRPIDSVDVSPRDQAIALAHGTTQARIWHRGETETIDLPTRLWGVAEVHYLPGGALVTAGHDYGTPALEVREAGDPATVEWSWGDQGRTGWLRAVAASPDGSRMAVGGDGLLLLFDLEAPNTEPVLADVDGSLRSLAFSPGGAHVIATDETGAARVFAAGDARAVGSLTGSDLIGVLSRAGWDQLATTEREGIIRILGCTP